jgi:GT2 family glycosyltransferase
LPLRARDPPTQLRFTRRIRHNASLVDARAQTDELALSVIVPAADAPTTLERCLAAIRAAADPPEEIIVVAQPASAGPAQARNVGAARARHPILVFVDADVLVSSGAFTRIREVLEDNSVTAVFGSYDDDPERHGLVSDFRNLLHHHVHQAGGGPATTFWAGLGAVRRDAFMAAGGFDDARFPNPSVEDIELGMRLSSSGTHIILDPAIQGKHLKHWTLASMIRTDLFRRGAPWIRLLLERGSSSNALNLGWRHRASVAVSLLLIVSISSRRPGLAGTSGVTLLVLNRSFYRLLARQRGWRQALAGPPLHLVHHLVSAAAVPLGIASYLETRRRR